MAKKYKLDTSIDEVDAQDIIERVELTALQYNGKGFTIEVLPEITKHKIYQGYVPLFGTYAYRPDFFGSGGYRGTSLQIASGSPEVDWNVVISKEVDKSYNTLPKGITIKKAPKSTLLDGRDTSYNHGGLPHYADYMEGHRVTISVSNVCAAKIFKEVYTDYGFPFRDLLLTKYDHILKKTANMIHDVHCFQMNNQFFVDDSHVGWSSSIATRFDRYTNTNLYEPDKSIAFTEFDMKPLASLGQKYGMVLAIIETLKNKHPKYRNAIFYISYGFYCCKNSKSIKVRFRIPERPIVESSPELNDW